MEPCYLGSRSNNQSDQEKIGGGGGLEGEGLEREGLNVLFFVLA